MRAMFTAFATKIAKATGSIWAFLLALLVIVVWGVTGPLFHFSDTWQLVINTGTTIITFLMVFLIQNTQNRDGRAMQLKLDELIFSIKSASNEMLDIEELTDEQLETIAETYKAKKATSKVETVDAIKENREPDE
jgi:low affinity Fe/Cu permease